MSCEYQTLYFGDEGYVVRCNLCGHYQLAFISTVITFSEKEFYHFYKRVKSIAEQPYAGASQDSKCIMVGTPSRDVHLVLTPLELQRLHLMVEAADNEIKTQELLHLFK